jgi:hypothetical protein
MQIFFRRIAASFNNANQPTVNIRKKAIRQWPDNTVKEYLDGQYPNQRVEWVILDESGLYGFVDTAGTQFACADDDEIRTIGITQFLIRNGGSYTSCV